MFFETKNTENTFDNKKTVFCFLFLRTDNMMFFNNIFENFFKK